MQDASWGDSIKRYTSEKRTAPDYPPFVPARGYRDIRFGKQHEHRAFHPLAQRYLSNDEEAKMQVKEAKNLLQQTKKAEEICIAYGSHYDVLTNEPKTIAKNVIAEQKKLEESRKKYERPPSPREYRRGPDEMGLSRYEWPHMNNKEYNILNNRYLQVDHEKQIEKDRVQQLQTATKKFFSSNHYNPISGTYYDPNKEQHFQDLRRRESLRHGQDKFRRMPLGLQQAEGSTYNIIAPHRTYDFYQQAQLEENDERLRDENLKLKTERLLEEHTTQTEKRDKDRVNRRISHSRYKEACGRGYDIVNNKSFYGRLGTPYAPPQTRPSSQPTAEQLELIHQDPKPTRRAEHLARSHSNNDLNEDRKSSWMY